MSAKARKTKHRHLYAPSKSVNQEFPEELETNPRMIKIVTKKPKPKIHFLPNDHEKANYQALAAQYPNYVNKKLKTIKWSKLSKDHGDSLSQAFLRRHKDYLDWQQLEKGGRSFTEQELLEFSEYIDWNKYLRRSYKTYKNRNISPNVFLEVGEKITGKLRPGNLTLAIAQKYANRIDWNWVTVHAEIEAEVFHQFEGSIDFYWASVNQYKIPMDLLWKYRTVIDLDKVCQRYSPSKILLDLVQFKNGGKLTKNNVKPYLHLFNLDELDKYHRAGLVDWNWYFKHNCYKQALPDKSDYPKLLDRFPFLKRVGADITDQPDEIKAVVDTITVRNCLDFWFSLPEDLMLALLDELYWSDDCDELMEWASLHKQTIPTTYWKNYRDGLLDSVWQSPDSSASDEESDLSQEFIMTSNHSCHDKWLNLLKYLPKKQYHEVLWETRDRVKWEDYLEEIKSSSFKSKIKDYLENSNKSNESSESDSQEYSNEESSDSQESSSEESNDTETSESSSRQSCKN